jgi:hypothetical protein
MSSGVSVASDLAEAFSDKLAQITVANGYYTDIGLRVYRGKPRIDLANVPCVVIYEAGDKVDDDTQSATLASPRVKLQDVKLMQRYFFEGHAECDPDHPNDAAHRIIADLKRALFAGDRSCDSKVRTLQYKGRSIGRREDGQSIINASIVVDAEIVENLAAP